MCLTQGSSSTNFAIIIRLSQSCKSKEENEQQQKRTTFRDPILASCPLFWCYHWTSVAIQEFREYIHIPPSEEFLKMHVPFLKGI